MRVKLFCIIICITLLGATLTACTGGGTGAPTSQGATEPEDSSKISVIVTNFAEYDFVRQITGELVNITSLLAPGSESHTFEPSAQQMAAISACDLFVFVGGESDVWVEKLLSSLDNEVNTLALMDCVNPLSEETVPGMEAEAEEEPAGESQGEEEVEYDEHVWTSPKNAIMIVGKLSEKLQAADAENADAYKVNTDAYIQKLTELDNSYTDAVNSASRKTFVVADRFPFRYLAHDYGLTYSAAYKGCSSDTSDPSPATIQYLVEKVKTEGIPVVFYIEFSNQRMADTIVESTGAQKALLSSCHNVTAEEFADGITYLDLMKANLEQLKMALN